MREIILTALQLAQKPSPSQSYWADHPYPIGQVPPGDYSFLLSPEQKLALERMNQTLTQLITCLQQALPQAKVYVAMSTSLEIQAEGMVVIELSLYGNLAAVFVYGEILTTTAQTVSQCLQANGLIQLSDDERDELEIQGRYHELF